MPTLHRFLHRDGYFIKGLSNGRTVSFELTPEGEQYLTETLNLASGDKFSGETLKWLYRKKWATSLESIPAEAPPAPKPAAPAVTAPASAGPAPPAPVAPKPAPPAAKADPMNPVMFQGVVELRLTGGDHTLLDQTVEDVVRTLAKTGAVVVGPYPLPVQVETYRVWRGPSPDEHDLRIYRRVLHVRNPRRRTSEAMNDFNLPREIDVKIDMHAVAPRVG